MGEYSNDGPTVEIFLEHFKQITHHTECLPNAHGGPVLLLSGDLQQLRGPEHAGVSRMGLRLRHCRRCRGLRSVRTWDRTCSHLCYRNEQLGTWQAISQVFPAFPLPTKHPTVVRSERSRDRSCWRGHPETLEPAWHAPAHRRHLHPQWRLGKVESVHSGGLPRPSRERGGLRNMQTETIYGLAIL